MMFLEDVLRDLEDSANVMVMLSSQTVYGIGETNFPTVMQDGVGNYRVKYWRTALRLTSMLKTFMVKDVTVSFESYMDRPQWVVTLENGKNNYSERLYIEANNAAIREVF